MGCCEGCGRFVLVIINILFAVIGLALFIAACIVRWGTNIMDQILQDAYDQFVKALEEAGESSNISELNIADMLGDATIAFIVIGLFFFLLGISGAIGACCKVRCLLIVYAVVLITIFVAEVVFVILLFTISSKVDSWLQSPILDKIKHDYTGINGNDSFTLAINFVMHNLKCCGIHNSTDFQDAQKWPGKSKNFKVPLICCANTNDTQCAMNPTSENSYVDKGCYQAITDWIDDNKDVLIGVGSGVAAIQLILIIFSIVICCAKRKDNDYDSYSDDMPIHPYRDTKDYNASTNPGYNRSELEHHSGDPGYTLYRGRGGGSDAGYQGKIDYYTGPPKGYDSRR